MDYFWKRVKDQIKAHKITEEKFAQYLGIPRSTFFRWLKYNVSPEAGTAYAIATALGVSVEYLVTGQDGKSEAERMKQIEERKNTENQVKIMASKLLDEVAKF